MLHYFSSLGHECPSTTNPADFALDIVSIDLRGGMVEVADREKVRSLVCQFAATQELKKHTMRGEVEAGEVGSVGLGGREPAPPHIAIPILINRGLLCFKRRPDLAVARTMQAVGLSICITLFSAPLKTDYISLQNRLGAIEQVFACEFLIP